jgi:outer membrane protein TolC
VELEPGASIESVERGLRALPHPESGIRIRAPGETPEFRHGDAVLPHLRMKEIFGEFSAVVRGATLTIDPAWRAEHIVSRDVPILDSAQKVRGDLPSSHELLEIALSQRPELAAQAARIRRERFSAALARKEFLPDMEFVARYDAFWQEEPLRPMVGMNINVPVYKRKRWAALREANARRTDEQATLESQTNEISFEVEQAYQRVQESEAALKVYKERILPSARHSSEAAHAGYTAGRIDFLRLVESQRQVTSLEGEYYDAVAEYHRRLAELARVVGVEFETTANQ